MNIILNIKQTVRHGIEIFVVTANNNEVTTFNSYNAAKNYCNRAINTGKAIMN